MQIVYHGEKILDIFHPRRILIQNFLLFLREFMPKKVFKFKQWERVCSIYLSFYFEFEPLPDIN